MSLRAWLQGQTNGPVTERSSRGKGGTLFEYTGFANDETEIETTRGRIRLTGNFGIQNFVPDKQPRRSSTRTDIVFVILVLLAVVLLTRLATLVLAQYGITLSSAAVPIEATKQSVGATIRSFFTKGGDR